VRKIKDIPDEPQSLITDSEESRIMIINKNQNPPPGHKLRDNKYNKYTGDFENAGDVEVIYKF